MRPVYHWRQNTAESASTVRQCHPAARHPFHTYGQSQLRQVPLKASPKTTVAAALDMALVTVLSAMCGRGHVRVLISAREDCRLELLSTVEYPVVL